MSAREAFHIVDLRGISPLPGESYLERLKIAFEAAISRRTCTGIGYEVWLPASHWLLRAMIARALEPIATRHGAGLRAVLEVGRGATAPEPDGTELALLKFRRDSQRIVDAWRVHVTACAAVLARRELELTDLRIKLEEVIDLTSFESSQAYSARTDVDTAVARLTRARIHHQAALEGMATAADMLLLEEQRLRTVVARGGGPGPAAANGTAMPALTID